MAKKAPGKHYRIGISLVDAVKRFSDEAKAEHLFVDTSSPTRATSTSHASESP